MEILLGYMLVGLLAGFVGGLFGVGGGVVIVPLLLLSFNAQGVDPSVSTHMAIGTSLAVIVFISSSSLWAHHKMGGVDWSAFKKLVGGIAVGSVLGGVVATGLAGTTLQIAFGCLLIVLGLQAGFGLRPVSGQALPGKFAMNCAGGVIGFLSAMFGIGGGSVTTPYLLWCGLPMRRAIGSSAACGLPVGFFSAITYSVGSASSVPEWTLGYVYLPALIGITLMTSLSVRWGAALAHYWPEATMKKLFTILSVLLGIRFIWSNLA